MGKRAKPKYPADHYINRELSWLEFNARVLEEAGDPTNPVLERIKFLAIFSSNLDEFFEVRVAGLKEQSLLGLEPQDYGPDGLNPLEQLDGIERRTHELVTEQYRLLREELLPELESHEVSRVSFDALSKAEREYVRSLFESTIYPVLTPLAIDPGHPFPLVQNHSLNIALLMEGEYSGQFQRLFGVVQVPSVLNRIVMLPSQSEHVRFMFLEDIIRPHLGQLFSGFQVLDAAVFRVTRNTDLEIEEEAEDLLRSVEQSLRERLRGAAVRLEVGAATDWQFVDMLRESLQLEPRDVYHIEGPVDLAGLMRLHSLERFSHLKDLPLVPRLPEAFTGTRSLFEVIRERDVLVHHPYESFNCVVDFIEAAADDPNVLAIKQTLYRTSVPSPIIDALMRAAQKGKQVTALVELRARYDEERNINWARSLERAGVHVVYGVVGLKTHCKASLVVRREEGGIRRYVHLATGNYNPITARIYTDIGLFTAKPDWGDDVSELFNMLTGYSHGYQWKKLLVAPLELRESMLDHIDAERENARAGRPARIIAKSNSLSEPTIIDALYRASQDGVQVDLMIRGICSLRPGIPDVSENIRVTSVVDRFLEHSRIFYFENDGDPLVFLGSADWMPRNFYRRIEIAFPVEDAMLRRRIVGQILTRSLADNVKARELQPDGTWNRVERDEDEKVVRSQVVFQKKARRKARKAREKTDPARKLVGLEDAGPPREKAAQ